MRRLLHDVAELTGQDQAVSARAAALHRGGLDEQHVSAGAGDGQSGGDARRRGARGGLLEELLAPERVAHDVHVDLHGRGLGGLGLLLWLLGVRRGGLRGLLAVRARRLCVRRRLLAVRVRRRGRCGLLGLRLRRGDLGRGLAQHRAELALEVAHSRLARVLGDDQCAAPRLRSRPRPRAGRCGRAGAATGSPWRSRASPRRCSRRSGSPPCGPAAGRGSCRRRWRWPGTGPVRGRARRRGSGRGRSGSARGRGPRAAPRRGLRASPRRPCRPRRAGSPGSSCRRRAAP